MKKFNEFTEALLVTLKPESDSVAPVEQCPCQQKDMMSQAADDVMKNLGGDVIQPTDGIGEYGDNQADGIGEYADEGEEGDVDLECTEDGLRVKFNGIEIVLPKNVIEKIKNHVEHEEGETPAEEETEHEETSSETEDTDDSNDSDDIMETEDNEEDEDKDKTVTESKKSKKAKKSKWVPPWIKNKGKGKDKKEDGKEDEKKDGKWNFNKAKK